MASKAFQQICGFLDSKKIEYGTKERGGDSEIIHFGANKLVQQNCLFIIETGAKVVQFRSVQILDEDDLKNYHSKPENRMKLYEYLLKCNYDWKLGKFALNPENEKVDLYFVISDYVDADNGIEEDLLDRVHTMLFGPSFAPGTIEKAIKNIKSILETGEKSADDEDGSMGSLLGGGLMEMIAGIASDPEMAKAMMSDPNAPQELRGMLEKMLGDTMDSSEKQAKEGDKDGI